MRPSKSVARRFVLAAVPVLLTLSVRADSDLETWGRTCALVLVPNVLRVQYGQNSATAFRDYMCGTYSQTHEVSGGLNVVKVFDANGSERTVTKQNYCHDQTLVASSETMYSFWSSTVPDIARTEFVRCMSDYPNQSGTPSALLVRKVDQPGNAVALTVSWNRNIQGEQPAFARISTTNLTCSAPWSVGAKIGPDPQSLVCRWSASHATTGFVAIDTQNRGGSIVPFSRTIADLGSYRVSTHEERPTVTGNDEQCGPARTTAELHNDRLFCQFRFNFPAACDGTWSQLFMDFALPLPARLEIADRTVVRSTIGLKCTRDNQGSCAWNEIGKNTRFQVVEDDASQIVVRRALGSRSIDVHLCAQFPRHEMVPIDNPGEWAAIHDVEGGYTFPVTVGRNVTAKIEVHWNDQPANDPPFAVGAQSSRLVLASQNPVTESDGSKTYTYRVNIPASDPLVTRTRNSNTFLGRGR
jgi:hypothetical protein